MQQMNIKGVKDLLQIGEESNPIENGWETEISRNR